jgi:hypothetical protein
MEQPLVSRYEKVLLFIKNNRLEGSTKQVVLKKLEDAVALAEAAMMYSQDVAISKTKLIMLSSLIADIQAEATLIERSHPSVFRETVNAMITTVQELTEAQTVVGWKQSISRSIKAAVDYLLTAMIAHVGLTADVIPTIHDKMMMLKPFIVPSARMNCFFELKELVNAGSHGEDVSLQHLEEMMTFFRRTLQESRALLLLSPHEVRLIRPRPQTSSRYKTVLCRNWGRYGRCPLGEKCQFAHGDGELKPFNHDETD